jgi:hypothetical protein
VGPTPKQFFNAFNSNWTFPWKGIDNRHGLNINSFFYWFDKCSSHPIYTISGVYIMD